MRKIITVAALALSLGACATEQENRAVTGAALGGATGAVVGGLATGRAGGALAGAAIGAAGGAVVGAATTPRRDCYYDAYGRRVCDYY
jgi:osmotically inducible lipoprotein OsmB